MNSSLPLCVFQERGVELLVDLLCETGSPGEVVQGEAAGVVAQLTSPCLQHGHHLGGLLHDLHRLLQALLRECQFLSPPPTPHPLPCLPHPTLCPVKLDSFRQPLHLKLP